MTATELDGVTLTSCKNLLAGNAIFTARHDESGQRFTYHLYVANNGKLKGVVQVRLLVNSDNVNGYDEVGTIDAATGVLTLTGRATHNAPSVQLIRWLVRLALDGQPAPQGVTLHHAGYCLRCRRLLSVPFPDNPYRPFGLGPECGSK